MKLQNVQRNNYSIRVNSVLCEHRNLSHQTLRRGRVWGLRFLKRWPFYITEIP